MARQGAVPGITVSDSGSILIEGREAVEYTRLLVLIKALELEIALPGMKASRFSTLKAAEHFFGVKERRKNKAVARLYLIEEAVRREMNTRGMSVPS